MYIALVYLKMRHLFIILGCFLSFHLFAQTSREHPVYISLDSLSGGWTCIEKWAFSPEDNPAFAKKDFDDSKWDKVSPLFTIDSSGKSKYNVYPGIGWSRYYFAIDSSLNDDPFAIIMRQDGASEVYLDGKLLFKAGEINGKGNSKYREYSKSPFIFSIHDTGVHVFAVRYANYDGQKFQKYFNANFTGFILSLYTANNAVLRQVYVAEFTTLITNLVLGVFLALAIVHFLLYLFYRAARYNLYFSLFNLSIALISYSVFIKSRSDLPINQMIASNALFFELALLIFSITGFINELFSKKKTRFKIFTAIILALIVLRFFMSPIAYILTGLLFFVVLVETFIVIIIAVMEKVKGAWIVGFGFVFLMVIIFIMIVWGGVRGNLTFDSNDVQGTIVLTVICIGFISVPISISAYLAWQFATVNKNLKTQLDQVQLLSEKALQQEQEKKQILESQNERLEKEVAARTQEIIEEKKKSDELLLNILPSEIAEELKLKGESKAHKYDEVSVLFTDFVNFTKISEELGVDELLNELNINFTAFDRIMEKHGLEKIKTIGDAYLAVSGLPLANPNHAQNTVSAALDILAFVEERKKQVPYGLDIRIGINSGSLIAGIVGVKKFAYDIWGDTVNTAARMEQCSEAGKINISINTYELVKHNFICTYRGKIDAKNKGEMDMYFIERAV